LNRHNTTSIFVTNAKFNKVRLFCLRDFQFFPTAVTHLSYRRMTAVTTVAVSHSFCVWWFLHLPAGQCSSQPSPWDCCTAVSRDTRLHPLTGSATEQSRSQSGGLRNGGILQERVYRFQIRDVDHLKERLIEEWRRFDQNIIDRAVKQWRDRLRKCVRAKGGGTLW